MDNLLALGLTIILVLQVLPYVLGYFSPALRRRFDTRMARMRALLDVAGGTLMVILVGILVWQREWLPAVLLGALSIPSWMGLMDGFRVLVRTSPPNVKRKT